MSTFISRTASWGIFPIRKELFENKINTVHVSELREDDNTWRFKAARRKRSEKKKSREQKKYVRKGSKRAVGERRSVVIVGAFSVFVLCD